MPSRQERRKAERDAAKRAPAKSGAGGAATALADVIMNPLGDWSTQAQDPWVLFRALGAEVVKQRAAKGEGEAQFSQGFVLVNQADGDAGLLGAGDLGAGGRSPMADVGLALSTYTFRVAHGPRRVDAVT